MARSLNSRCDFKNGFFTCDLPEDTILLVVKVKTKTGNHTLVEDTEKWTDKFRLWKKPTKDGKTSPRKLLGVLAPRKNDNSMTSDSGPCPSGPRETEYKPRFFDEPDCLSSDKENVPPTEKTDVQCNKIHHLEYTMTMYGVYNSDTLTDLIDTVHRMQNFTTWNKKTHQKIT